MVEKLEDSLNGCFKGVYAEVAIHDSYRLRQVDFQPDTIFDLGGNVGVFSRFARFLFPKALIVTVEPNPDNCEVFRRFTDMQNMVLHEAAIGRGKTWHTKNVPNGAHEEYLSASDQISSQDMDGNDRAEVSSVKLIMPDELISQYVKPDDNILIKIDIEGNENTIWEHQESLEAIATAEYLVVEIHPHVFSGIEQEKAKQNLLRVIEFLKKTHEVEYEHIYLFARKK